MVLSSYGILGINARNLKYLRTPKRIRRILDSKLLTKKLLSESQIPVLETLAVIKSRKELLDFDWDSLPDSFALKPNRGLGGEGIIVVFGRKKKMGEKTWIKSDGGVITKKEIEEHIFNILEGYFSLFSLPDVAFFEERARVIKELKPYSFRGIPDIRVIVYENIPVMAMLRLPTKESRGRANLHQGAIGVGIDLATGLTTNAIFHGKFIDYYPGTRYLLRGIKIPDFSTILILASKSAMAAKARFLGVDLTIDREKGPVVLELNTRPGLQIQLANLAPLEERLKRVEGLSISSPKKAVRIARDLFGEEEEVEEEIFGKKVLGVIEEVELLPPKESKEKSPIKILAKVDTGAWRSAIAYELAQKLGIEETGEKQWVRSSLGEEIRMIVPLSFILKGERIDTHVFLADRSKMRYKMIIGRRDLKNFIIDPSKR